MLKQIDKGLVRETIAKRAEQEIVSGSYVNLGIGMPTIVANFIQQDKEIVLQSENGLLGIGVSPLKEEVDPELINAGKETVTASSGASFFNSAESFAMIRGGHLDLAILGGMEVSENGDLANWMIPGKMIKGMGGAMDIVHGARKIVVVMEHVNREGASKIVKQCQLPLTGKGVASRIITERAVIDVKKDGLVLMEVAKGWTVEEVIESTNVTLGISDELKVATY